MSFIDDLLAAFGFVGAKASAGSPPIVKSLDVLDPDFRTRYVGYLADMSAAGMPLVTLETARTWARQAYIYAQGRTMPGPVVTNAQPGSSRHERVPPTAADTWPKGLGFTPDHVARAVAIFQSPTAISLRSKWLLKNLPQINDFGHVENA